MTVVTPNSNLTLPDFDQIPWQDQINENFRTIDAIFFAILGLSNIKGPYKNSTQVNIGERYFDIITGTMFEVLISYVTGPAPMTFAEDRTANPLNWKDYTADAVAGAIAPVQAIADEAAASQIAAAASAVAAANSAATYNFATQAEAEAGVINTKGMSPLRVKQAIDLLALASQAEAETGTDNTKLMSPLRVAQFLAAKLASLVEVEAGTDNAKYTTPLRVKQAIDFFREYATQAEAEAGAENTHVMTALRTKQLMDVFHAYASQAEAEAGSNNTKIMTPLRVAQFLGTNTGYGIRQATRITTPGIGVFTPDAKTKAMIVTLVGPGGGGGGVDGQGAGTAAIGGNGGGGAVVKFVVYNMAQIFDYQVGTKGLGGAAGANNGTVGTPTYLFPSLWAGTVSAGSGTGGAGKLAASGNVRGEGGGGGNPNTLNLVGDLLIESFGETGLQNLCLSGVRSLAQRVGGNLLNYSIAEASFSDGNGVSPSPSSPGCGGAGGSVATVATNYAGGNGTDGMIIFEELW